MLARDNQRAARLVCFDSRRRDRHIATRLFHRRGLACFDALLDIWKQPRGKIHILLRKFYPPLRAVVAAHRGFGPRQPSDPPQREKLMIKTWNETRIFRSKTDLLLELKTTASRASAGADLANGQARGGLKISAGTIRELFGSS